MIKAILFDADGVVINADMWSVAFCKEFNVPNKIILPFFEDEFQACLIGKADLKKEIVPYLKKWRWKKSVDDFLEYWFKSEHKVDRRIVNIIKELKKKGIKCCLTTNQEGYRTQYMKKQMGFKNIFDKIFSSAEVGFKKSHPKFFSFVTKELKLKKNEIQYWDDNKDYIKVASQFGLDSRHYIGFREFNKQIKTFFR